MGYRAERQADIDQTLAAEDAERQAHNRRRFGAGRGCPNCGDVPDGMRSLDVGYLADILSVYTLGELRRYLRETAAEGTKWYRKPGDTEIILYYSCWQCGPEVPPAEYQPLRITGGNNE